MTNADVVRNCQAAHQARIVPCSHCVTAALADVEAAGFARALKIAREVVAKVKPVYLLADEELCRNCGERWPRQDTKPTDGAETAGIGLTTPVPIGLASEMSREEKRIARERISPTPRAETVWEPECPGPECLMCSGEACNLCGAGCWSRRQDCEHDSVERHEDPRAETAGDCACPTDTPAAFRAKGIHAITCPLRKPAGECVFNEMLSCICDRGTRGCDVRHGKPAGPGEGA